MHLPTCKGICLRLYLFLDLQIYNLMNKLNMWKTKLIYWKHSIITKIGSFQDNHPLSKLTQAAAAPKQTTDLGSIGGTFYHQTSHRPPPWSFHTHQKHPVKWPLQSVRPLGRVGLYMRPASSPKSQDWKMWYDWYCGYFFPDQWRAELVTTQLFQC